MRALRFGVLLAAVALCAAAAVTQAPAARRSQNSVALSVPASVQIGKTVRVTVNYTAIEDDGSSATLTVGLQGATDACVPNPYTFSAPGVPVAQDVSVSGTGSKTFSSTTAGALPGTYRLCAWLTSQADHSSLAGPATADFKVTPAPTEQSWVGRTSQHHRFGLGTLGETVIGFNYPQTRLRCTGTQPYTPWVDWYGFVEQISISVDARGAFAARLKTGRGNSVSIHGVFSGNTVKGTITDSLRPVAATGITLNTPPHRRVTGGVCRATIHFTAVRSRP